VGIGLHEYDAAQLSYSRAAQGAGDPEALSIAEVSVRSKVIRMVCRRSGYGSFIRSFCSVDPTVGFFLSKGLLPAMHDPLGYTSGSLFSYEKLLFAPVVSLCPDCYPCLQLQLANDGAI
jgi:hypothetical protein